MEDQDTVESECPSCGEDEQRVLRAAASGWTLACTGCKAVRTVPAPPQMRMTQVRAIISEGATAQPGVLEVPLDEPVKVGHELEHDGKRLLVTGIEAADGTRPGASPGRSIKVLHVKRFDTVRLGYSVNRGDVTTSYSEDIDPEEPIEVGTVREVEGVRLVVKTLKSDQNRTLHHGFLLARNIRRVFADLAPKDAKPGQRRKTRTRGADPRIGSQGPRTRSGPRQPSRSRRA